MRVTIQIRSGPHEGRRYALGIGQQLRFGRTELSDVALPEDTQLSSVHFQVVVDRSACRLTDLGSTNGTRVNHEPVQTCVLEHGDMITAGGTTFQVQCEGSAVETPGKNQPDATQKIPIAPATAPSPRIPTAPITTTPSTKISTGEAFAVHSCPSGLFRVTGSIEQLPAIVLAQALSSKLPMYLLLDPHRFDVDQEQFKHAELLLDWLDPAAAVQVSPVFIRADETTMPCIEAGWGADAIITIFSTCKPQELLSQLRELSKPKNEQDGMLGLCWPKVLAHLLESQQQLGSQLTEQIGAFLIEDPEDPQYWRLIGRESLAALLDEIGMQYTPAQPTAAEAPA